MSEFLNLHAHYENPEINNGTFFALTNQLLDLVDKHGLQNMFISILSFCFPTDVPHSRWIVKKKRHRLLLQALFSDMAATKVGKEIRDKTGIAAGGITYLGDVSQFIQDATLLIQNNAVDNLATDLCLMKCIEFGLAESVKMPQIPGANKSDDYEVFEIYGKLRTFCIRYLKAVHKDAPKIDTSYEDDDDDEVGDDAQGAPTEAPDSGDSISVPKDIGGVSVDPLCASKLELMMQSVTTNDLKAIEVFLKSNPLKICELLPTKLSKETLRRSHKSFAKASIDLCSTVNDCIDFAREQSDEVPLGDRLIHAIAKHIGVFVFKIIKPITIALARDIPTILTAQKLIEVSTLADAHPKMDAILTAYGIKNDKAHKSRTTLEKMSMWRLYYAMGFLGEFVNVSEDRTNLIITIQSQATTREQHLQTKTHANKCNNKNDTGYDGG